MVTRFLLHIVANAAAVMVAAWLLPNVIYEYEIFSLAKISLMLAMANFLIKPVLKIIFSPLILITLGLFTLIINIFLVWLVVRFAPELSIVGFNAYFLTMIIVSTLNFIASMTTRKNE